MIRFMALCLFVLFWACSENSRISGGSTTVENGIAVRTLVGGQAVSAQVQLIPMDYDPKGDPRAISTRQSDAQGWVMFDSVGNGEYAVYVQGQKLSAYVGHLRGNDTARLELSKSGQLLVLGDSIRNLRLRGTPFVAKATDSGMVFENLPVAVYETLLSGDALARPVNLKIQSDSNVVLDLRPRSLKVDSVFVSINFGNPRVFSIDTDPLGRPWIATSQNGLWYENSPYWDRMTMPDGAKSVDSVFRIRMCPTEIPGTIGLVFLIQTNRGVSLYEDGLYQSLDSVLPEFAGQVPNDMAVSSKGWAVVATDRDVYLHELHAKQWTKLGYGKIKSLAINGDTLWLGSELGQVYRVNLTSQKSETLGALNSAVWSIRNTPYGLFAGNVQGLWKYDPSNWIRIAGVSDSLRQLELDSLGVLWGLMGAQRLMSYEKGQMRSAMPFAESKTIREISALKQGLGAVTEDQKIYRIR